MWQLGKQKMIAEVQGGGWGSSGVGERWVGWGQKSEVEPAGVAGDGFPVACASSFPCDLLSLSCLEGVRGEVTVGTWVRKSERREGPLTSAWQESGGAVPQDTLRACGGPSSAGCGSWRSVCLIMAFGNEAS